MTIGRDLLTKAVTVMVAAIEAGVPTLVEAREIITQFHLMIRRRLETGLTPWIERARASLIASFASGVARDEAAVRAAITSSWSNGQTEGQITRLELVRRQMYGGGKLDLLQAGLIGAIGAAPKLRQSQCCKLIPIMLLVATSEKPRNVTGATLGRQHDIIA
jgi:transposase